MNKDKQYFEPVAVCPCKRKHRTHGNTLKYASVKVVYNGHVVPSKCIFYKKSYKKINALPEDKYASLGDVKYNSHSNMSTVECRFYNIFSSKVALKRANKFRMKVIDVIAQNKHERE